MSLTSISRRSLLKYSAAGLAAGALPFGMAKAQTGVVLGIVYVGPKDDFGWNQAHAVSVESLKALPASPWSKKRTCPRPTPWQNRWSR